MTIPNEAQAIVKRCHELAAQLVAFHHFTEERGRIVDGFREILPGLSYLVRCIDQQEQEVDQP